MGGLGRKFLHKLPDMENLRNLESLFILWIQIDICFLADTNYLTTWLLISGAPFVLLMNQGVYDALSAQEKGWVDAAADATLSAGGGAGYARAAARGLRISEEAGVEIIELPDAEKRRFARAVAPVYEAAIARSAGGDLTVGEVIGLLKGE